MLELLKDIWKFMLARKKYWLIPTILLIIMISVLAILAGSSAAAPFIYSIF